MGTALSRTHADDVEDPLTAYVDAPLTSVDKSPFEHHAEEKEFTSPVGLPTIGHDNSADLHKETMSKEIPAIAPEDTGTPANQPGQDLKSVPESHIEDPDTTGSQSPRQGHGQSARAIRYIRNGRASRITLFPMRWSPTALDERIGDRRDAVRRGRRKSDRINEQLLKQSIRVDAGKIDDLMNQVGELVVSRAWFSQLFHEMRDLQQNLQHRARLEPREMKQVKGLTFRLSEATVGLRSGGQRTAGGG